MIHRNDYDISKITDRTYWPYGFHGQQIRWNGTNPTQAVGTWQPGALKSIRTLFGLPPNHGAWFVVKAQYAWRPELPPDMIAQIREAHEEGFLVCVQFSEYDHNGYTGPNIHVDRPGSSLVQRARAFAKRIEAIVGSKRVVLEYGNEWSYSGGGPTKTWSGTEEEWHEREALCCKAWQEFGFYTAVGSDPDTDMVSESLTSRRQKLRAHGVDPKTVAVLFHSYGGVNKAPPIHGSLMATRIADMGFGASVWSEAAVLVNGNVPPNSVEVRWLASCAVEARKSFSALCHFTVYRTHEDYALAMKKIMAAKDGELYKFKDTFPLYADASLIENAAITSGKIAAGTQTAAWSKSPAGRAAYEETLRRYSGQYAG